MRLESGPERKNRVCLPDTPGQGNLLGRSDRLIYEGPLAISVAGRNGPVPYLTEAATMSNTTALFWSVSSAFVLYNLLCVQTFLVSVLCKLS